MRTGSDVRWMMMVGLLAVSGLATAAELRLHPQAFAPGGWKTDVQFMDVMGSPYLLAHGLGHRVTDATIEVDVPSDGAWRVWVRTRTWVDAKGAEGNPSAFRVAVGGVTLGKAFGLEGSAWHWEDGGLVELKKGVTTVALKDLFGFDARCAGIVLADGEVPPEGPLSLQDADVAEDLAADVVIVGGGVPGTCAAVAAARSGLKTVLVQDRPVLGGNASSEIRVWCAGELCNDIVREVRGRFMNMEAEASIGDDWRQRVVDDESNIVCRVSHRAFAVEKSGDRISAVKALDLVRSRVVRFSAPLFVDATGDGWIGYWAGADWRMGREAKSEYGETMAPAKADGDTLGASLMWTSYRAGTDEPFSAPWAEPWAQGEAAVNGEWNWEYGIHRDVIREGEAVRDRLLLAIYGAFSNAKKDPKNCRQVLNFVPYLLGKRESRRLLGDWVLSEKDVTEKRPFEDAVSRGSWSVDLHFDTCKPGVDFLTVCNQPHYGRYYIPFRSLYSRNVPNLMMAGRCFSCTHVGLGGPRVINTLAQMGVACGYAAAICREKGILPRQVYEQGLVRGIQRKLGGDWPGNPDPDRASWRIVDDEDAETAFGAGWKRAYNCNGCTVNDKYSVAKEGAAAGPAEYRLPVDRPGRYHLMRNAPYLPWHAVGGETLAEIVCGDSAVSVRFPALERVGDWTALGTFELGADSRLRILPSASRGAVYADGFALVPEDAPLFGRRNEASGLERLNPHFAKAFAFLRRTDLANLPNGRYEIDGTNCWANIFDATLRPCSEELRFEAHRDTIDIHVPLTGEELIGFARTPESLMPELAKSPKDCVLFDARGGARTLKAGEFAVVFPPYGAHAPSYQTPNCMSMRKLVVKIRCGDVAGGTVWSRPICVEEGRYIGWPTVTRLRNGDILAVFSGDREAHICPYGKVQMIRSSDGGETWSKPVTIADGPIDDRDAGIVQMPDGEVVVTYFTSVAYYQRGLYKEGWKPELMDEVGFYRVSSRDNGRTWSKPEKMRGGVSQSPHGPKLLKDGSLIVMGRSFKGAQVGANTKNEQSVISVWKSTDAGRNWTCLCPEVPDMNGENAKPHMFHEPDIAELPDGTLIGQVRYHGGDHGIRQTVSTDGGRTWSPMRKTELVGYPSHLLVLSDGRLLSTYSRRLKTGTLGEFAALSADGGRTWDVRNEVCLRAGVLPTRDYGYPSSCVLPDGSVLTVYYHPRTAGEKPCLMATKWRIPESKSNNINGKM